MLLQIEYWCHTNRHIIYARIMTSQQYIHTHALTLRLNTFDTCISTHQHLNTTYAMQLSSLITAFRLHFSIKLFLDDNLQLNLNLLAKFRSTIFTNHWELCNLRISFSNLRKSCTYIRIMCVWDPMSSCKGSVYN